MVDRIVAAVFLLLTLGYGYVGSGYDAQFSYEPIGPRAFPLLLAGIAAACWLWLVLRPKSIAEDLEGLAKGVLPQGAGHHRRAVRLCVAVRVAGLSAVDGAGDHRHRPLLRRDLESS